jgi:uncharacterized protein YpuA (DUF1002 family)
MKKLLSIITATVALTMALTVAAAETKKVCIDRIGKDGKVVLGKDGKPAQDCKEMKIHKKLDGTKVPEKK